MNIVKICNRIIEYSFYSLFLLVPLVFTSDNSELFELNKMWLTFGLTILIALAWFSKMVLQKRILLCRTPLDIPILLFLLSQIISTFNSLDFHVSLWGYYSRFNGGLLSIISYIFLYYAFVSNFATDARGDSTGRAPDSAQRAVLKEHSERALAGGKVEAGPRAVQMVKRLLVISLISGLIVTLWGLPAHFGYDPTCFMFRGNFDVSCWTDQFQPRVRIFSTLGQPNWMGTYLAILIPILIAFAMKNPKFKYPLREASRNPKHYQNHNEKNPKHFGYLNLKNLNLFGIWNLRFGAYILSFTLFLSAFFYTRSRSSFMGLMAAGVTFFMLIVWQETKSTFLKILVTVAGTLFFILWTLSSLKENQIISLGRILFLVLFSLSIYTTYKSSTLLKINRLLILIFPVLAFILLVLTQTLFLPDFSKIINSSKNKSVSIENKAPKTSSNIPTGPALEGGGTESGRIRKIVWKGAIEIWRNNPIFGTGVETYAFAYYKYRPAEHNLVSEWEYLYNKAHNEYLNYLATTGIFGLGTYLLMIGWFLWLSIRKIITNNKFQINTNVKSEKFGIGNWIFEIGIISSYVSILISNFLGFSIVIVNIYLFLIPAFILILTNQLTHLKQNEQNEIPLKKEAEASPYQLMIITIMSFFSLYLLVSLFRFWQADKAYALGYNLDRAGRPDQAYPKLQEALSLRNNEPVFQDELSINDAVLAMQLAYQKDASSAGKLAQEAIGLSDQIVASHPNNVVFWKSRVRVFYTLSQVDPKYLSTAVEAIDKAQNLAPTDAKIAYNQGLLHGTQGNIAKAIEALEESTKLKPNYQEAYYALGLYYREASVDKKSGKVINSEFAKKAVETMEYILKNINPENKGAKDSLKNWGG